MSKRKFSGAQRSPLPLKLEEEQIEALQQLPETLPPRLRCLVPFLDSGNPTATRYYHRTGELCQ